MSEVIPEKCAYWHNITVTTGFAYNCYHHYDKPHYCPAIRFHKCKSYTPKPADDLVAFAIEAVARDAIMNIKELEDIQFQFCKYRDQLYKATLTHANQTANYLRDILDKPVNGVIL
jgi:hypothetical protein